MQTDPLSDILAAFDTRASVSGGIRAGGDWSIRFPPPDTIKFGAVLYGNCWLQLEGQAEPVPLSSGDVFVVNGRFAIRLYTDVTIDPVEATDAFANETGTTATLGQGDQFHLLGGHLALDPVGTALLTDVLPPLIRVAAESDQAANLLGLLERLVTEMASARPGSAAISQPLAHLLFVHVLRDHIESGTIARGWLKALGDRRIAPAIGLMHAQPARNWHLAELAEAVGMSRSNFAERFKAVSGMSPLSYLRFWRMRLAENALQSGARSLASLSASLGYASESAFSTAFKQAMGVSPAQYRARAHTDVDMLPS
ncbi:AraC family transcriptional regulator [Saccharospirillum mangrovi]|uniref:AraC family transcriptional regulator n=1 Tax=Saccharospirillum mangrovi TaxID=2161747 RepID=UPI000D37FA58|nr:AraC family transcriptional regulator [Saccharospirillum mangrovi]